MHVLGPLRNPTEAQLTGKIDKESYAQPMPTGVGAENSQSIFSSAASGSLIAEKT